MFKKSKMLINYNEMNEESKSPPWVVFDPDTKAEFVIPKLLHYYVANVGGKWFICDRLGDTIVHGTEADTRAKAIRLFYELNGRPIPEGWRIPNPVKGTEHTGIG